MPDRALTGRYAPSPTGDLHLGNLRTALLAWLQARLAGGQFLLRMEDLDQPRIVAGSAQQIIEDLHWLGLDWDGPVEYQSKRQALYQEALQQLQSENLIYPCFCSRKELREIASAPHASTGVYPGTCAGLDESSVAEKRQHKTPALRVRVGNNVQSFTDAVQGFCAEALGESVGDFVVRRADKLFAYQLAVVVDDLAQGVTHVVRGADLADSTARQLYLAQLLNPNKPPIEYWHVPLLLDESGARMAKRDGSESANAWRAQGKTAEQLVALFARQLQLLDAPNKSELTADELLQELNVDQLRESLQALQQGSGEPAGPD